MSTGSPGNGTVRVVAATTSDEDADEDGADVQSSRFRNGRAAKALAGAPALTCVSRRGAGGAARAFGKEVASCWAAIFQRAESASSGKAVQRPPEKHDPRNTMTGCSCGVSRMMKLTPRSADFRAFVWKSNVVEFSARGTAFADRRRHGPQHPRCVWSRAPRHPPPREVTRRVEVIATLVARSRI